MGIIRKNSLKIIAIIIICLMLNVIIFVDKVLARDNFAFSVATTHGGINTIRSMNAAAYAYVDAGYHSYGITDPPIQQLRENMYADVQFYSTHGNVDHIQFANCGIVVGNGNQYSTDGIIKDYIGTNEVTWDTDNTILVTYISCLGSGNEVNNYDSICATTCEEGAEVVVGFRRTINSDAVTEWNERYSSKLGEGYGVADAVRYANSFSYVDENVKWVSIWNHGNDNIRIGKYRNLLSYVDNRNILKNTRESYDYNFDNITKIIKKNDKNFDINNYVITSSEGINSINVETNITKKLNSYIDLKFKIGDFITNLGYTMEVVDGKIISIYDNSDKSKQEELLKQKDEFYLNLTEKDIKQYEIKAKDEINSKYKNEVIENENVDIQYFYDVNSDKKVILLNVTNKIDRGNGLLPSISCETIKYDI